MAVRLVDYKHEVEHDVEFGTCEICMSTGDLHYGVFVFEDDSGNRAEVENGSWSWGDYDKDYYIENIIRFADFFNSQKIESLVGIEDALDKVYYEYDADEGDE